jgi:hypothetical protein
MKWDYNRYLIGKKVEFFTNGELGKPLSDVANYALDAEMGLRYKVTDWASLNLKAERDIISGTKDADLTRPATPQGLAWPGKARQRSQPAAAPTGEWYLSCRSCRRLRSFASGKRHPQKSPAFEGGALF